MPMTDSAIYHVMIAGAGPTGLLLAGELAAAGCSVLVLEQADNPAAPSKEMPFGLRGLSVPTIELCDRRGLLPPLRAAAAARDAANGIRAEHHGRRQGGHFAGIDFFYDEIDAATWPHRLFRHFDTLAADLTTLERLFTARAEHHGAEIRRGARVERIEQEGDAVVAIADGRRHRGRWLVGCDGGRSAVRKAAGIDFPGTPPEFTGYSVQLTLADPSVLEPGRTLSPGGVVIYAPPGTIWMAEFDGGAAHRTVALTREHVEAVLRRVSGADITVRALEFATSWTDRACLAATYRKDRVMLAGDAAHIHSPLGGQGLNLGLGDAMNLGWKLSAVVHGRAEPDLLDSYAAERRPVAADILERSRAQVALLRPDPGTRALEAVMRDLIETGAGTAYFAERVSGIGIRYDLGGGHSLVGRSAPNFTLADGSRVNERLREGRGLLVDFTGTAIDEMADRYGDRVPVATSPMGGPGLAEALIRPDGVVAWASSDAADRNALDRAVERWFGRTSAALIPEGLMKRGAR